MNERFRFNLTNEITPSIHLSKIHYEIEKVQFCNVYSSFPSVLNASITSLIVSTINLSHDLPR